MSDIDIYNADHKGGAHDLIQPIINFYYILILSAFIIILFLTHEIYVLKQWDSFRVLTGMVYYFTILLFSLCASYSHC
jgi:ABC-type protease/lipase transport system fused ATPase/permease subunit